MFIKDTVDKLRKTTPIWNLDSELRNTLERDSGPGLFGNFYVRSAKSESDLKSSPWTIPKGRSYALLETLVGDQRVDLKIVFKALKVDGAGGEQTPSDPKASADPALSQNRYRLID